MGLDAASPCPGVLTVASWAGTSGWWNDAGTSSAAECADCPLDVAGVIGLQLALRGPYTGDMKIERVSVDHRVMGGVPCIRGTRIPVATVIAMLADGMTMAEIVADYPQLVDNDIRDALRYAAAAVDERELPVRLSA